MIRLEIPVLAVRELKERGIVEYLIKTVLVLLGMKILWIWKSVSWLYVRGRLMNYLVGIIRKGVNVHLGIMMLGLYMWTVSLVRTLVWLVGSLIRSVWVVLMMKIGIRRPVVYVWKGSFRTRMGGVYSVLQGALIVVMSFIARRKWLKRKRLWKSIGILCFWDLYVWFYQPFSALRLISFRLVRQERLRRRNRSSKNNCR